MTREYDNETKAAVMAALLAGQAVSRLAKEHDIPRTTIYGWRRKIKGQVVADVAGVATQKKSEEIGGLLLELVEAELRSLIVLAKTTQSEEWIIKQPASELAVWLGVRQDKLVRMLDMFGQNEEEA